MRQIPYKWLALMVSVVGVFMSVLDSTIVNIAVPSLIRGFRAPVADVQWVITGYLLALGASIPLSAYLADRFGIKRVYAGMLGAFTIASMLCALAPNLPTLVAFRVLQGLGGGGLMPLSLAIVFRAWPAREIGRAMGYSGVPILFAPALGPTLGGYLVDFASWRFIFFINVPIGLIGLLITLRWLRDYRAEQRPRLDLPGLALCTSGTVALLYGVAEAATTGWGSARVLVGLVAGGLLLGAFVLVELRTRTPLLELRLYQRSAFLLPSLVTVLASIAMFGGTLLMPLYLQNLHGYTAFEAGMIMLPQALASAVAMPIGGRLYDRGGARLPTLLGFTFVLAATVLLLRLEAGTAWPVVAAILLARGLGTGLGMMPTTSAAMTAGEGVSEARVSALLNITRQLAAALGVALLATILQSRVAAHVPAGVTLSAVAKAGPVALHGAALGFHETFAILALLTLPVFAVAARLRDTRPARTRESAAVAVESAL